MSATEQFYDNALDASGRISDLEQFREHMEGFLSRERTYFQEEAHPDLESQFLPLFSATFPPILHSSLVVSSVMLIELELRAFADALQKHLSLPLSMSDLQGSLLERFRKYAVSLAGLEMSPQDGQWADVVGVFEIRNCLVHNYGSLDRFSRRAIVEGFAQRHGVPALENDIIKPDDATSAIVLKIASSFFDIIYEAALHRFPGPHNWPIRFRS